MRNDITKFFAIKMESMYKVWERFKDLLRKYPYHKIPTLLQVQTFYNSLTNQNQAMVDATTGGTLMRKNSEETYELLDEMTLMFTNGNLIDQ